MGEQAMPYAEGRTFLDADSHIMELHDWLASYADPAVRDQIGRLKLGGAGRLAEEAVDAAANRRTDPGAAAALEERVMTAKGWSALGAFDPAERSRALDLLGFDKQLVFSTFSPSQFLFSDDPDVRHGGNRAHNRAMVDFCSHDDRLLPVALVPLDDPVHAAAEVEACLTDGVAAVHVTHDAPPEYSHTHPVYDGVWGRLAEAGVPFVLHVGGSRRGIRRTLHNNGLPPVTDFIGGGENVRAKDYMALHHAPEVFVACMAMDGVFERFPRLHGGVIELGALWVPSLLTRLDLATNNFRKTEPQLTGMPLKPSEYVRRQMWFTPFPGEPVGQMIDMAGDDLFMFSSDYPHPEGTKDPLGRFEATMEGVSETALERFYSGNFADMLRIAA
jgi:predicted TIM-barrel fold metal-dependent hydrolase